MAERRASENEARRPPAAHDDVGAGKWKVLACVIFGIFMVILDTTVINVAFPTLRQEFRQPLSTAQWIVSVYVLALGTSTPIAGFLADRFGMKRMYIAGLLLFVSGSAIAGISPNIWVLIGARAIQAAGGGIAVPLGTAFLFSTFPPEEQGTALGYYGIGLLVAPAVGPILGGALVDRGWWRWIFYINVPIGIVGAVLGWKFLPQRPGKPEIRLDRWGLLASILGFGALLYGSSVAADIGWSATPTLVAFGIGLVAVVVFVLVDLFATDAPLLEFRLYRNRVFLNASLVGYVSVLALFGAEFLLPLYLQTLRGLDALRTGLVLLPLALVAGITTPIAGRLYDRVGPRILVVVGFAVLVINTWQLSKLDAHTSIGYIRFLMALRGFALGATVQSTFTTALGTVNRQRVARGSSLVNSTRFVVQSIGVALLTTILTASLSPGTRALQRQAQETQPSIGPVSASAVPGGLCVAPATRSAPVARACAENLQGFEEAYRFTFYAACVALVLGAFLPGWPFGWAGRGQAGAPADERRPKPAAA